MDGRSPGPADRAPLRGTLPHVSGTDVAAVIGAVGALGCLLGRSRAVVAGGLVAIGLAEAVLSRTFAPSAFDSACFAERRRLARIRSGGVRGSRRRLRPLRLGGAGRHGRAGADPPPVRLQHEQAVLHRPRRGGCARTPAPAVHGARGRGRRARLASRARGRRACAAAAPRCAGRPARRADEPVAPLGSRPVRRSEPARLLRAPVRGALRGRRATRRFADWLPRILGDRGGRPRLSLRRHRHRRGMDSPPLVLRAEARRGEQLHELLPRDVLLLRPVDLRASPRRRADGPRRRAAARARVARRLRPCCSR